MFNGIGLLLGFVMQRSRFCFTAAFRDLFMFNSGRNMKGVIVGMAVATVGFCLIMANLLPNPTLSAIAPEAHANPVGLHLVLGGLLFGVWMAAAGGCTSARDGYFAYLPEGDQDTVAMLDMRTLRVVRRVDMGKHAEPHMLRVARDDKGVWVANAEANSVVVLDAKTLRPLAKIAMGKVPVTLAFTPDHQFAYVFRINEDNFVSVVDTGTCKEVGRIKVAQGLAVVAFRPDGKFAYVAAINANAVAVIDTVSRKVVKMILAGTTPFGLIVAPASP